MQIGALKVKLQLVTGDAVAFGPGKADLLEAIRTHGSISAAGRALGMSYRRCWLLVDEMNRCFRTPLVETAPGGGAASGARLSAEGARILAAYRSMEHEAAALGGSDAYRALDHALRDQPLPAKHAAAEPL